MEETIGLIFKKDEKIIKYMANACAKWDKYLNNESPNIESICKFISKTHLDFEHDCGGRDIGQELMVLAIFFKIYSKDKGLSEDKRDQAWIYREAFSKSSFSIEGKAKMNRLADYLGIKK
jgi:hypothetical protein